MEGRSREEFLLKRELKRARLFEVRKIIKKVKLLEEKRGNEAQLVKNKRKSERLLQELEAIKEINLGTLANSLSLHNKDTLSHIKEPPLEISERAKWRLVHSKCMSEVLKNRTRKPPTKKATNPLLFSSKKRELSCDQGSDMKENYGEVEEMEPENSNQTIKSEGEEEEVDTGSHDEMDDESIGSENGISVYHKLRHQKDFKMSDGYNLKRKKTFEKTTTKNYDSVFVGSLSSREKIFSRKQQHFEPKNRMGQRARRKLWEQRYGDKANHRRRVTARGVGKLTIRDKRKKQNSKLTQFVKQMKTFDTKETLHPSWEASRKRKQQQSLKTTFEGSHIVFNDSD